MIVKSWRNVAVALTALFVAGVAADSAAAQATSRSAGAAGQAARNQDDDAEERRERGQTRSTSDRQRTRPADPAQVQEVQRTRGAAEAPAVAQAAGLTCQISDSVWLGSAGEGETANNLYEVACAGGLGYVLVNRPGQPPLAVDCLTAKTTADREAAAGTANPTRCILPANANPATGLQPVIAQLGRTCTVNNGRAIGGLTGGTRFEVGCAEGPGLVIDAPTPGSTMAAMAISCLEAATANVTCQYTTAEQTTAQLRPLLTGPAASCAISQARYVGRPAQRPTNTFYEVACGEAGGFIIESTPQFTAAATYSCDSAEARALRCQYTVGEVAQTQEIGLYTQAAQEIGLTCPVTRYNRIGREPNNGREVVELVCGTQAEAVVAFFPIPGGANAQGEYIDCLRAEVRNIPCRLTPLATLHPRITQQLQTAGQTCPVSAVRVMGRLAEEDLVEVACDAATRGFVIALPIAPGSRGIGRVLRCVDARDIGGGCELPANAAGDRPRS